MGYEDDYAGTETVYLANPKYWVEVKKNLSRRELEAAQKFLTHTTLDMRSGNSSVEPDIAAYHDTMVLSSIVDWNLTDANNEAWPVNEANVKKLSGRDFDRIWKRVDELNAEPDPKEAARFPGEGVSCDPDAVSDDERAA